MTSLIRKNKYEYFEKVNVTCAGNSRKCWREIKRMLPQVNFKSTSKSLIPDMFNVYFKNVTSAINDDSKSDSNDDTPWKGSKSSYIFTFVEVPKSPSLKYLKDFPDTSGDDIIDMNRRLLSLLLII